MLADRYIRTDFTSQEEFERYFSLQIPEHFHFAYDIIDEYARTEPGKRALIWCDLHGNERTFTFGEMSRLSNQAANVFAAMSEKGRTGDGDCSSAAYQFWIAFLGLLKLGCVLYSGHSAAAKKGHCFIGPTRRRPAPSCVWTRQRFGPMYGRQSPIAKTVRTLFTLCEDEHFFNFNEELEVASPHWEKPKDLPANEDRMLMYFTSGTTGMPKMSTHNWVYPIAQTVTGYYWHNLGDDDIHMAVADTGWAKAGWGKMFGQWICGATLFVYDFDRLVASQLMEVITRHRVTSFCAPPTVYRFMIKEDISKYDFSHLRWANCAGEPLNPEVYEQFLKATGVKIREGFGQTETTPLLMTTKWMEPKPGSTGKPSPAYHIALVDAQGNEVEDGVEGEIVIRLDRGHPPGLFAGYYHNQEQTDEVFQGGLYHTGDMAWRDVEGYYYFIGRSDDVIKSSGYRIGPFEVESALLTHPAVLECAVTAVPDPDRGQVVKATVVLAKNRGYEAGDELVRALQKHVKSVTAPYKYPRIIEFVEELPKTISGKIQRKLIRTRDEGSRTEHQEAAVKQSIALMALVVRDYDEAIAFFTQKLDFILLEDTYQQEQDKRWVVVAPPGSKESGILLARASKAQQEAFIGEQTGGRVFLFLQTNDFWRDYRKMLGRGIEFVREPKQAPYGTVAVFKDLYGNLWDLVEYDKSHLMRNR